MLEPFLGKSTHSSHGQRVVEGQRMMQAASDILLGWIRTESLDGVERDFYVRQLWDAKGSALVDVMNPRDDGIRGSLRQDARQGARALRRRHRDRELPGHGAAASTGLSLPSPRRYADQNERDYAAMMDAVASGRIVAEAGL